MVWDGLARTSRPSPHRRRPGAGKVSGQGRPGRAGPRTGVHRAGRRERWLCPLPQTSQPCAASQWPDLTESPASSATGGGEFLSRPEGLLARAKKHVAYSPPHSFGVSRPGAPRPAGRPSPGPSIAIEAAAGVARDQQGPWPPSAPSPSLGGQLRGVDQDPHPQRGLRSSQTTRKISSCRIAVATANLTIRPIGISWRGLSSK